MKEQMKDEIRVAVGGTIAVKGRDEENQVLVVEGEKEETMDPSEVSDNLSAVLQAIKGNGTFATSGHFSSTPNPALSINGTGVIGPPLSIRKWRTDCHG